ncbi:MAG: hypothetical protein A3D94_05870 [Alphaproteobacteria bacterium RIFCSPHIGHO2_12_FULL_66_14]|jgi:hypothetical protein|nr:MAG: hypothetical protein A3D94_05870 [Alphaproteobacteria bacterium RIFCSPHIGHO2_12_FULL_66_14]
MTDKIVRMRPTAKQTPGASAGLCALASAAAPFVYFDRAPNFGFNGAVANISLEVVRFAAPSDGAEVVADRVTVAHLRMTLDAMRSLKAAIEGVERIAEAAGVPAKG